MSNLIVFYDGWCPVCKREIMHYKKLNNKTIDYFDIREKNIHKQYNLNPVEIRKSIYSLKDDKLYSGIDTFLNIWTEIPRYKILYKIFSIKILRPFYDFLYDIFAIHIRPRLSSKKDQWD